jgi:cytochrome P450
MPSNATKFSVLLVAAVFAVQAGYNAGWSTFKRNQATRKLAKQRLHRPSSTLPLFGNTLDVLLYQHDRMHDWFVDQCRLSGGKPWLLSLIGKPPALVITSPELCEDILKTQFKVFGRGEDFKEISREFLGNGILNAEGNEWVLQRRMGNHLFSTEMLRDVIHDVAIEKTEQLCDVLAACAQSGKTVSMKSLLAKFTSDVFAKVGFGVELNGLKASLEDSVEQEHPFLRAIADYGSPFRARLHSPVWLWKLKRFLNVGDERQVKKSINIVLDLIHDIMREAMTNRAESSNSKPRRDLLTLFIESTGSTDPVAVRDMVINFFLAGKDTSSSSMAWFLIMMNRHPHALHKIREEIRANLPDLGKRVPTMEELHKLPYLEAAIRESLRLNMTGVYRAPDQDTTLVDGTFVPKDTNIILSIYAAARMESIWGPDAGEYRPERFLDKVTGELKEISPFKFLSFIGGPRQCLGIRFAMMEMKTLMATLLDRFDITTVEDPFSITYSFSLVLPVKGELMVSARELV